MSLRVLLSCGETSGDMYAGALLRALRVLAPDVEASGLAGPQFAAAGGRLIHDYRDLAVTGLTEAVAKIPRSYALLRRLAAGARAERPDVAVVVDFPDFNLPLARRLHRLGIPVVYYISPQIWAWRARRLDAIREVVRRVLVIFPFEEALYRQSGVPVEFVGHPLVDFAVPSATREAFLATLGLRPELPTVAILPGSRPNEIRRILPGLLAAARAIRTEVPAAQFVLARAPSLDDGLFEGTRHHGDLPMRVVEGDADTVLASADVALTASGTATVQTALHGTPMVIVYRLSSMTYWLARRLVRVPHVGMVNLIADARVVPEFVQDAFTPEAVAAEAVSMLKDPVRSLLVREDLARVRARLGGPGASGRAAAAVLAVAREGALKS